MKKRKNTLNNKLKVEIENESLQDEKWSELLLVDDLQLFQSELEIIEDRIMSNPEFIVLRKFILFNFLTIKLEEIELHIRLVSEINSSMSFLKENDNIINSLINIRNLERIKNIISENLDSLMFPSDKKTDKSETENEECSIYNCFPKSTNLTQTPQHQCITQKREYNFRIFYYDGTDHTPQKIKLSILPNSTVSTIKRHIKKQLGIFEFAKFRIYLKRYNKFRKFRSLLHLEYDAVNDIKLVPI
jgi:hypothetical protein